MSKATDAGCPIDGCGKPRHGRWCSMHYERWRLHGSTDDRPRASTKRTPRDPVERFWPKVNKTETCWLWTAAASPQGYGRFYDGSRIVQAHRFGYELRNGPIPAGLHLDHLCAEPRCVRADHLEPVTVEENSRRQAKRLNAERDSCPWGHPYPENKVVRRNGSYCRICVNARSQRRYDVVRAGDKILREAVYDRYRGVCGICNQRVPFENFHVDHVVPLAKGGEHTMANLRPAHPSCNVRKGARLPA